MKKIFAGLILLISLSSFASTDVTGEYQGKIKGTKEVCSLKVSQPSMFDYELKSTNIQCVDLTLK